MRATLFVCAIALVAFVCTVTVTADSDPCNKITACSECLGNSSMSCGWCSDWNGCMAGTQNKPYWGTCKSWHKDTCAGVSVPRVSRCNGGPISPMRVRQLMGGGGTTANITTAGRWTVQSRKCNSVTGCTDWADQLGDTPVTIASLLVNSGQYTVYLNLVTGFCTSSYCTPNNFRISFFDNRYVGLQTSQVGETELTFSQTQLPYYSCPASSTTCNAYPYNAPGGTKTYTFTAQLTDNCLVVSTRFNPDTSPMHTTDYLELYVTF